jgi:arylsulfatase B
LDGHGRWAGAPGGHGGLRMDTLWSGLVVVLLLGRAAAAQSPNVLLVIADDMGVDLVNAYHEVQVPVHTPVLDGLAANGVLFRNAWSNTVCTPSRVSMMLGRQAFRHGVGTAVNPVFHGINLHAGAETLAHVVAPVATPLALGKWQMNLELDQPLLHPLRAGFAHYRGNMQILPGVFSDDYYAFDKNVDGVMTHSTTYSTTDIVDDALELLAATPEPWFVWLAFNAPHAPFHKPPASLHTYSLPSSVSSSIPVHVKAVVEAMDTELGRLLDSLDPAVRANTLVIFVGDNGTTWHATVPPFDADHAKGTLYEGGLNVPLIVSGPGVATGAECGALVSAIDLYATIAEAFGVAHASGLDSVSLLPYFADPALPSLRDSLFSEYFEPAGFGPYTRYDRAVRDARWKLLHRVSAGVDSLELYDLAADPFEQVNLLAAPPLAPAAQAAHDALLPLLVPVPAPWNDAGYGLYGSAGFPRLGGSGSLVAGEIVTISVSQGRPLAPTALFVGADWIASHFKGGILGPSTDVTLVGPVTDAGGSLSLVAHWPAGVPGGTRLFFQVWLKDVAAIQGLAATNDLIVTAP